MCAVFPPSAKARAEAWGAPRNKSYVLGMTDMNFRLAFALCLTALPALSGAALADTREQVMLRLPRCGAINDTRQYLDCYYAAVQPMRTELGLAGAPQDATYAPLFSLGTAPVQAGTLTPQTAATREDVMLRLTRCAAIGDTRQYLDCYYAAAQPMRADLGLAPAPQAATYAPLFSLTQSLPPAQRFGALSDQSRPNLVPQTAYTQVTTVRQPRVVGDGPTRLPILGALIGIKSTRVAPEQFGLPNARPAPGGVDHIASRIAKALFIRQTGDFTITLENGQVWRQVANDDARARWSKNMAGTLATVAYGAGDTFNLSVGEGILYKVHRVS